MVVVCCLLFVFLLDLDLHHLTQMRKDSISKRVLDDFTADRKFDRMNFYFDEDEDGDDEQKNNNSNSSGVTTGSELNDSGEVQEDEPTEASREEDADAAVKK